MRMTQWHTHVLVIGHVLKQEQEEGCWNSAWCQSFYLKILQMKWRRCTGGRDDTSDTRDWDIWYWDLFVKIKRGKKPRSGHSVAETSNWGLIRTVFISWKPPWPKTTHENQTSKLVSSTSAIPFFLISNEPVRTEVFNQATASSSWWMQCCSSPSRLCWSKGWPWCNQGWIHSRYSWNSITPGIVNDQWSLCLVLCNNHDASFDALGSVSVDDKIRLGEELSDKEKPDALQKTRKHLPACSRTSISSSFAGASQLHETMSHAGFKQHGTGIPHSG